MVLDTPQGQRFSNLEPHGACGHAGVRVHPSNSIFGGFVMKQWISKSVVLCFVMVLALGDYSLAKGRKSLTIYEKSRVNDVVLEPGDYKVEIVKRGDSADVMIYKGEELVAKAKAQPEKLEGKADRNSVRFAVEGSKAPKIIELRLSGESQSYKLADGTEVSQRTK
jgi:hypothetical protein